MRDELTSFDWEISRHPFFATQEGAFLLPRARAGACLSYIMRRDAAQALSRGNGECRPAAQAPLNEWGSRVIPAASVSICGHRSVIIFMACHSPLFPMPQWFPGSCRSLRQLEPGSPAGASLNFPSSLPPRSCSSSLRFRIITFCNFLDLCC